MPAGFHVAKVPPTPPTTVQQWAANENDFAVRRPDAAPAWEQFAELEVADADLVIRITRPRDLVALVTVWHGVEVMSGAAGSVAELVAGQDATLAVHFPFQHAQEQAWTEAAGSRPNSALPDGDPLTSATKTTASTFRRGPAQFRAARGSRLVFDLPPGARVQVATEPILALLPTLTLRVHGLARPGKAPADYPVFPERGEKANGYFLLSDRVLIRVNGGIATVSVPTATQIERYGLGQDAASRALADEWLGHLRADLPQLKIRFRPGVDIEQLPPWFERVPQARPPAQDATFSTAPTADQTAIEAPFRLVVSPDARARWVHASAPVGSAADARHVELWHSRLGRLSPEAEAAGDETALPTDAPNDRRIVRAVWARDRDHLKPEQWQSPDSDVGDEGGTSGGLIGPLAPPVDPSRDPHPFTSSLNRSDRHRLVRQSAESWIKVDGNWIDPDPVAANRFWLSALGATIDLHGHWNTTPYSGEHIPSILAWDHIASFGRDQFVRVVYPGYLFPLGHKAVRVKITERKIRAEKRPPGQSPARPVAGLFQREFVAVIQRDRLYSQRDLPFVQAHLGPAVTPSLDPPGTGYGTNTFFWPTVGGVPFRFRVDAVDHAGRGIPFTAPLLWVAEHVDAPQQVLDAYLGTTATDEVRGRRVIDLGGRTVTLFQAPKPPSGDDREHPADLPVQRMRLTGVASVGRSEPYLSTADVVIEAARSLANTPPTTIAYHRDVVRGDLLNAGGVWAVTATADAVKDPAIAGRLATTDPVLPALPAMLFGAPPTSAGPGRTSETGGGFVAPSQVIAGLSTVQGTVADLASGAVGELQPGDLDSGDALAALGSALPRLFGLVKLTDLLASFDAPEILATIMEPLAQLQSSLARAQALAADAPNQAKAASDRLLAEAQKKATDAVATGVASAVSSAQAFVASQTAKLTALDADAKALATDVEDLVTAITGFLENIATFDLDQAENEFDKFRNTLKNAADHLRSLGKGLLPPLARNQLAGAASLFDDVRSSTSIVKDVFQAVALAKSLASGAKQIDLHFDWSPELRDWPTSSPILRFLPADSQAKRALTIEVTGRAGIGTTPSLEVLAELRQFRLVLLPAEPLVHIDFEHLSFRSGTSGKTEVDVELGTVEFVGLLSFVETIKDLIPFDGFSDPPNVTVDTNGLTAGYTLALPSVAIGVFALSNMSLSADIRVPFLGDALSVGFGFCSRERPFTLAVCFLGGGGWFGMRLSPRRLELLEIGLEAGAFLSVDFGVASGSISAVIGIYLRLESDKGSLTGYFRLRGEVDVLGLISASIELAMSLTYDFHEEKVIGRASITVEVEVLCFSQSVTIEAERKFAGSNGDPTVRQLLASGTAPWTDYLDAFATEPISTGTL